MRDLEQEESAINQIAQALVLIARVRGEIDYLKVKRLSGAEVVSQAQSLSEHWFELPREDRRAIVEAMVERIEVGDGEISIELLGIPTDRPPPESSPFLETAVTAPQTLEGLPASVVEALSALAGAARPSYHHGLRADVSPCLRQAAMVLPRGPLRTQGQVGLRAPFETRP